MSYCLLRTWLSSPYRLHTFDEPAGFYLDRVFLFIVSHTFKRSLRFNELKFILADEKKFQSLGPNDISVVYEYRWNSECHKKSVKKKNYEVFLK